MLEKLREETSWEAVIFFLGVNIAIFVASVTLCYVLGVVFKKKRIFDRWQKLQGLEIRANQPFRKPIRIRMTINNARTANVIFTQLSGCSPAIFPV